MKKLMLYAVLAAGILIQPASAQQIKESNVNAMLKTLGHPGDVVSCKSATDHETFETLKTTAIVCHRETSNAWGSKSRGLVVLRLDPNRLCIFNEPRFTGNEYEYRDTDFSQGFAMVDKSWREIDYHRCMRIVQYG